MIRFSSAAVTLTLLCAASLPVGADIIPPSYHYVERCATIDNLASFPDIVVIGAVYGVNRQLQERYRVMPDSCLYVGYKFNTLKLFWVSASEYERVGISGLTLQTPFGLTALSKHADTVCQPAPRTYQVSGMVLAYGVAVPDSVDVVNEDYHYQLLSRSNGITLYLSRIDSYDRDQVMTTQNFDPPTSLDPTNINTSSVKAHALSFTLHGSYAILTTPFDGRVDLRFVDVAGRTVQTSTRECRKGSSYVEPLSALTSGLYWIQAETPAGNISRRVTIVR